MIVDVFMFDDEFAMLDCRVHELEGVVSRFIAIEGNTTFTGTPKPYYLTQNIGRYDGVPLTVVQMDLTGPQPPEVPYRSWITPQTAHAWVREGWQRNGARSILNGLSPDTWLIAGDLDEIPRREIIIGACGSYPQIHPHALEMRMHVYSTSLVHPAKWAGGVVGRVGDLGTDLLALRDLRWNFDRIPDAGWHLTWFGDPMRREEKLLHLSHQELVPKIQGSVGESLPKLRTHVDGETPLGSYAGTDFPRWVVEGRAPASWHTRY